MPGSRFPGQLVIREVRKGQGNQRVIHYYGGKQEIRHKRKIYELARDRGFDVAHRRFTHASPETQDKMLTNSLRWQGKAKERWLLRLHQEHGKAKDRDRRYRLQKDIERLTPVVPRSPLVGHRPVSSYLRRYWP